MNKQIKQLLENLFDDYDDLIQDDNDNIEKDSIGKKITDEDIKKKVKEWLRYNIASSPENNNIDRNLTFEYIDDILYCNLHFNGYMTVFMSEIPDYVKINKITCKDIKFNSLYNLPKEIDGDMFIDGYNHTKLVGDFPEKIGALYIYSSNIKSLEGLNNNCVSIKALTICDCNNLQDLIGIPESVETMQLSYLKNLSSLKGCPSQLNSLNIRECAKLKSLKYISPLITGDFTIYHTGLVDLSNGPKEVGGNYNCSHNQNLVYLNAQDTFMSGPETTFRCYSNDNLKELTGLPKMKYKDIKVDTDL